jgi:hypothetical protein
MRTARVLALLASVIASLCFLQEAQAKNNGNGYYGRAAPPHQRAAQRPQRAVSRAAAAQQQRTAIGNMFWNIGPIQTLLGFLPSGSGAMGYVGGSVFATTGCLFDRAAGAAIAEGRELGHAESYQCLDNVIPFLGTAMANSMANVDLCAPKNWGAIHYGGAANHPVEQNEKLEKYLARYCGDVYPSRQHARRAIRNSPLFRASTKY